MVNPNCSGKERIKTNGEKAHSKQKLLALLRRIINATTKPGDIVLDPFLGSGATAVAAKELGRSYIGIERDSTYVKVARKRLADTTLLDEMLITSKLEAKAPRVAFGLLVDTGLIKAGATLTILESYLRSQNVVIGNKIADSINSYVQNLRPIS